MYSRMRSTSATNFARSYVDRPCAGADVLLDAVDVALEVRAHVAAGGHGGRARAIEREGAER